VTDHAAGSVDAWDELVAALATAGCTAAGIGDPGDVDVVEGFRYVLNLLGDQLDRSTLRDSGHPVFLPGVTPVRKLFFDNPDTDYDTAFIMGDRTYRIVGTRGTATYLAFCAYSGGLDATRVANLADADMAFAPDGSFELTLSPTEPAANGPAGRNWIRLEPGAHTLIARQYFLDRASERPARYRIEAVGDRRPDPPLDGARFSRLARGTARFVTGATELARRRAEQARARPNRFVEVPGHGVYGTPDAGYVACWYELGPGEALAVDVRPPRCRYWGVHLANLWGQSLDHRTRTTVLNARTATTGAGGAVHVVVAHADPGEPNWLDTAGHPRGWVLFRWLLADEAEEAGGTVVPDARVVTLPRDPDSAGRPA
jgi:uncharacterized protein DUF1214